MRVEQVSDDAVVRLLGRPPGSREAVRSGGFGVSAARGGAPVPRPVGPSLASSAPVGAASSRDRGNLLNPSSPAPVGAEPSEAAPKARRIHSQAYLRGKLRRLNRRFNTRLSGCGQPRAGRDGGDRVELHRRGRTDADGVVSSSCHWQGVETCGSVWSCPTCAYSVRTVRAAHVKEAVEAHGQDRCGMITFTVAHSRGDNLREMLRGQSRALSRLTRGKPWQRFCEYVGLAHRIRGCEPTHSEQHGWHPHEHCVWFFERKDWRERWSAPDPAFGLRSPTRIDGEWDWVARPKSPARLQQLLDDGWTDATPSEWVAARWQGAVEKEMGKAHRPSNRVGTKMTDLHDDGRYLVKLGLELLDPTQSKKGRRGGSRSAWQIAQDWCDAPPRSASAVRDAALWTEYSEAYKGMRALTWSRGAQEALLSAQTLRVAQSDDDALAAAEDQTDGDEDDVVLSVHKDNYYVLWSENLLHKVTAAAEDPLLDHEEFVSLTHSLIRDARDLQRGREARYRRRSEAEAYRLARDGGEDAVDPAYLDDSAFEAQLLVG